MAAETALEDRRRVVARIVPHEEDFRAFVVVIPYTTYRLLNFAFEKIRAIELEFPSCAISIPHALISVHGLSGCALDAAISGRRPCLLHGHE
jgi:hypothetical protein